MVQRRSTRSPDLELKSAESEIEGAFEVRVDQCAAQAGAGQIDAETEPLDQAVEIHVVSPMAASYPRISVARPSLPDRQTSHARLRLRW